MMTMTITTTTVNDEIRNEVKGHTLTLKTIIKKKQQQTNTSSTLYSNWSLQVICLGFTI